MLVRETLDDADIPCHDKMREAILDHWQKSFECLKVDLSVSLQFILLIQLASITQQNSCGKISFTADIWSNANMQAYIAVTSHWISGDQSTKHLSLKTALIGFHCIKGSHTGINIAEIILHLLDRAGVTLKVRVYHVIPLSYQIIC